VPSNPSCSGAVALSDLAQIAPQNHAARQGKPFRDIEIVPKFEIVVAAAAVSLKPSSRDVATYTGSAVFLRQRALGPMIANLLAARRTS
jgi:hypothetical protein